MMKKLFTIIFALLLASNTFAQSLEILQPLQMIENSSVLAQYKNQFGKHEMPDKDVPFPFALIRVRLEGSGTEVTAAQQVLGLQMGTQIVVADMDRSQTNEILFLVPITAKNIYVTCGNGCKEQLLVSSARLRPNTVYTCKVHYTPEEIVYGPKKPKITSQYLLINVTPSNAIVEVDGNLWTTNNGVAGNLLDFGEHSYRVSAPDYASTEGKVVVNDPDNTQSITVQLKPRFCSVTLRVENNAEIWVNGAKKGAGQWTGNLGYGPYRIETRLQGHIDGMVQQTISENDANRTITLPAPTPIYGSLRVETQPFQADIYLDGKNVGKTPKMFSEVIIGSHKVEVKMAGYEGLSTTQTITEGQMAVVGGALTAQAKPTIPLTQNRREINVLVDAPDAEYYYNGVLVGKGKDGVSFPIYKGRDAKLIIRAKGFLEYSRILNFDDNVSSYNLTQDMSVDQAYVASEPGAGIANVPLELEVKGGMTRDQAIQRMKYYISDVFETLEINDNVSRWYRTVWNVEKYPVGLIRTRVELKEIPDNGDGKMKYKILLQSQISTKSDPKGEDYLPWDRVLKKYANIVTDMLSLVREQ